MPATAVVRHIGEGKRGRQLSAPTQSDAMNPRTGALRIGQTAPNIPSNKGLRQSAARYNPRIPGPTLLEIALFSAGSDLRSAVQRRNPKPPIPGMAKRPSLRHLEVSRILAQSPL